MTKTTAVSGTDAPPTLPPALAGERREMSGKAGRVSYYVSHDVSYDVSNGVSYDVSNGAGIPGAPRDRRPLLLIHSVNAAASAYEVKPLFDHFAVQRPTFAIDLPGYGFSDRSDRPYTIRLMTDALHDIAAEIARLHPGAADGGIDALAVSLGCEFLARAATEQPHAFRCLALVSPTGLDGTKPRRGAPGSDRGMAWLYRLLSAPIWAGGIFRNLTRPGVIRFFLEKTWGGKRIDDGMLTYAALTARQPGARHAPLSFVSGRLFAADVTRLYESLQMPVWMTHGVRGDFTDYRYKAALTGRSNWRIDVMQTGAMPYFEQPVEFNAACASFLSHPTEMR